MFEISILFIALKTLKIINILRYDILIHGNVLNVHNILFLGRYFKHYFRTAYVSVVSELLKTVLKKKMLNNSKISNTLSDTLLNVKA